MIKILKTDLEGRLILTEEDLEELLDDAFVDGYNACMADYDLEEDECDCCDKCFVSDESYTKGFAEGYDSGIECYQLEEEPSKLQTEYVKGFIDGMNDCLNNIVNTVNKETTKKEETNSKPLDDLNSCWDHWMAGLLEDLKNESK